MKNLFLIGIILLNFCDSYSQDDNSIVDTFKIWTELQQLYSSHGSEFYQTFYRISDSMVIKSVKYQKVFSKQSSGDKWTFTSTLLREYLGKVYYINTDSDQNERILYDFTLKLNDTIISALKHWIVDSIDSIKLNDNKYKKRLHLTRIDFGYAPFDDYWIEGIGSVFGLFNLCYNYTDFHWGIPHLICVKGKNGIIYSQEGCDCQSILEIKENISNSFQVFPTIVSNNLQIISYPNIEKYKFSMYDLNGRLVKNDTFFGNQIIDCSSFNKGVFIIRLDYKKGNTSYKIIKQ